MREGRYSKGAALISLDAVLTALGLIGLYGASITPSGRLGLTAAAGLFPAAAVVSGGISAGILCYAATGLLALLLVPEKSCAILYLSFFGFYPLCKHWIEKLKKLPLEWLCKLALFNAALAVYWLLFRALLLSQLPAAFESLWVFCLVGNLAFVLYDLGFSKLISFYLTRIHRAIFKG